MSKPRTAVTPELLEEMKDHLRVWKEAKKRMILRTKCLLLPIVEQLSQSENLKRYEQQFATLIKHIEDMASLITDEIQVLSDKELLVALMVKNGMTKEEIAIRLHITPHTVKTYRRSIRQKLGITGIRCDLQTYLQIIA